MDLVSENRVSAVDCWVCAHHHTDAVIWPQNPLQEPQYVSASYDHNDSKTPVGNWTTGQWEIYLTSYTDGLRSGRFKIWACVNHYNLLGENWIAIAQSEVDLENRWHSYMNRIEK